MRPKVSFFINRLRGWGGVERLALGILRNLHMCAWDIDLVLCTDRGARLDLVPGNISVVNLNCRERLVPKIWALRRYLTTAKPRILLGFMWPQNVAASLGAPRGVRLVFSEQHLPKDDLSPTDRFAALKLWMIRRVFPRAECIVAGSRAASESWRVFLRLEDPCKLCAIPNGIDIEGILKQADEPVEEGTFQSDCKYVITIARLIPRKNISTLIRAFDRVVRAHPEARLLIVGEGPERGKLERLAAQSQIANYVRFVGLQLNPYKYLGRCHVFCLPSTLEGDGIVNKEAMALGVPVVASNLDCIREVIVDGKCGYLVPADSPEAFAERLSVLLADNALRTELGEAGRERASLYAMDIVAQQFRQIIEEFL